MVVDHRKPAKNEFSQTPRADGRCIGNPLPGVTLKLVPDDADVYEIRVAGVAVTPGYLSRPDLATTRAVPTPTGTARIRAMNDDCNVPTMRGQAP